MKFVILGDLHGNIPKIYFKNFDAIIAPGDFCSDATRVYMFEALKNRLKDPNYKKSWYDLIGRNRAKKEIIKSLKDGRVVLEKVNSYSVPAYIVPGNWDWTKESKADFSYLRKDHYKNLIKDLKNLNDCYYKLIKKKNFQVIGYGVTSGPEYPQYEEDKKGIPKKKLKKLRKSFKKELQRLDRLFVKAKKSKLPIIFLSHNVPFNTKIDKIVNKQSPRNGWHYGSLIVRKLIEKHQPLVCIGGHMHEHFTGCRIGKTICINSSYGSYVNVLLEIENNKIKQLKFFNAKNRKV